MSHQSLFERNPRLTLTVIILFLIAILLFAIEWFLGLQDGSRKVNHYDNYGVERHIILRESRPLSAGYQIQAHSTKKYYASVDAHGFLEPSEVHKKPDKKIFFLGGSTTECFYNDPEKRFPYLSGRLLEAQAGQKINAYNAGRSNNNSAHSIDILYNKILALKPDVVVLMHNVNDLGTIDVQGSYWNNKGMFPLIEDEYIQSNDPLYTIGKGLKDLLIPHLYVKIKALMRKKRHVNHPSIPPVDSNPVDYNYYTRQFESNLNIFISICRNRGITPVLMTQANRLTPNPEQDVIENYKLVQRVDGLRLSYKQFSELHKMFNESIRRVGRKNGTLVIDLDKKMPKAKKYMFDAYHLTNKGSILASKVIAEKLLELK